MKHTMQALNLHKAMMAIAAAGLFSLGTSAAFAQQTPQTVDMTVTGTIVPAACTASFAAGDTVDFGTIRLIDLPANAYYALGNRSAQIDVACSSAKRVTFALVDGQSANKIADAAMYTLLGTPPSDERYIFGLGTATVGGNPVNLGSYAVQGGTPTIDSAARTLIFSYNGGLSWGGVASAGRMSMAPWIISAGVTATAPTVGQNFSFPLTIYAALNYGSRLQVAQDTRLNGQLVFAISYQ